MAAGHCSVLHGQGTANATPEQSMLQKGNVPPAAAIQMREYYVDRSSGWPVGKVRAQSHKVPGLMMRAAGQHAGAGR